jgi:hypothetical protein
LKLEVSNEQPRRLGNARETAVEDKNADWFRVRQIGLNQRFLILSYAPASITGRTEGIQSRVYS